MTSLNPRLNESFDAFSQSLLNYNYVNDTDLQQTSVIKAVIAGDSSNRQVAETALKQMFNKQDKALIEMLSFSAAYYTETNVDTVEQLASAFLDTMIKINDSLNQGLPLSENHEMIVDGMKIYG